MKPRSLQIPVCLLFGIGALMFEPAFATEPELIGPDDCQVVNPYPIDGESISWSGACLDGFASGEGKLVWFLDGAESSRYEGTLLRGRPNGMGRRVYHDGREYSGHMLDGKADGQGSLLASDGSRYEGSWKNGKRDGFGTEIYATGGSYVGIWKANQFHGKGRAVYTGGQVFEGEFANGIAAGLQPVSQAREPELFYLTPKGRNRNTGVSKEVPIALNVGFGFDKGYASMNASERRAVNALYPMLHEQDEPPFPLGGIEAFTRKILARTINSKHRDYLRYLRVLAQIDIHGKATSVLVYEAQDKAMVELATQLLMQESFKPGMCNGTPCAMAYIYSIPLNASYSYSNSMAPGLISHDPREAMRMRTIR